VPTEPPPTSQAFLNAISLLGYNADHDSLAEANGDLVYPHVNSDTGAWSIGTSGDKLSHATYLTLKGATAQSDGSYTDTLGNRWWLEPNVPSSYAQPYPARTTVFCVSWYVTPSRGAKFFQFISW